MGGRVAAPAEARQYGAGAFVLRVRRCGGKDKTFKAVPGSGGVSVAANQIEGRYALGWADNIWADSLAL